jgi:hypothetical protein
MNKEFLEEIKESFSLLDREKNWDDEGVEPISVKAFNRAMNFLFDLLNYSQMELRVPFISG